LVVDVWFPFGMVKITMSKHRIHKNEKVLNSKGLKNLNVNKNYDLKHQKYILNIRYKTIKIANKVNNILRA